MIELGVIGLGTMGANLARNAARNGVNVFVFNRTASKTDEFMKSYGSEGDFSAHHSLEDMVKHMKSPRVLLMMVKAGQAVDAVIDELLPLLMSGDVLIDGGNSHFRDTERRQKKLTEKGIHLIGMGVSGGEEGALLGPSLMPGGNRNAYDAVAPLLREMAASDGDGGKCVTYIGPGGAGHFVKMVHNGVEYGLMQVLAEIYDLLRSEYTLEETTRVFEDWLKKEEAQSFLLEITVKILQKMDEEMGKPLIELIKDEAGQKGTGKWTTEAAMELGTAIPTINAAVDARIFSASHWRRNAPPLTLETVGENLKPHPEMLLDALELSFRATYGQGFSLLFDASAANHWSISLPEIVRIWRGGCIIRSAMLAEYQNAFAGDKEAGSAIISRYGGKRQKNWRKSVVFGLSSGIPIPAIAASLTGIDAMRQSHLPQNLIQAQRDYFGAHGYQRIDQEGTFHTDWHSEK